MCYSKLFSELTQNSCTAMCDSGYVMGHSMTRWLNEFTPHKTVEWIHAGLAESIFHKPCLGEND